MVTEFGMSEKLGPMQFGQSHGQVFLGRDIQNEPNYSDAIAYEIDTEIQRIIKECYERCKQILTEKRDQLELVAQTLLKVETLEADQIKALIETGELIEPKSVRRKKEKEGQVKVNIKSEKSAENKTSEAKDDDHSVKTDNVNTDEKNRPTDPPSPADQ